MAWILTQAAVLAFGQLRESNLEAGRCSSANRRAARQDSHWCLANLENMMSGRCRGSAATFCAPIRQQDAGDNREQ